MPVPEDWHLVQLRDAQGGPCGCWRFELVESAGNTACLTHANDNPKAGHVEFTAAARAAGYNGKIFLQHPFWSVPGKYLSRRPRGQFTGAPAFYVDMVFEKTEGAVRAGKCEQMVCVEIDGSEHEQSAKCKKADRNKEAAVTCRFLRVSVRQVEQEDDGDYSVEADRIVSTVYQV